MRASVSQCAVCRHFLRHDHTGAYCRAYPTAPGIPDMLRLNWRDHRESYRGDRGTTFAPVSGAPSLAFGDPPDTDT